MITLVHIKAVWRNCLRARPCLCRKLFGEFAMTRGPLLQRSVMCNGDPGMLGQ